MDGALEEKIATGGRLSREEIITLLRQGGSEKNGVGDPPPMPLTRLGGLAHNLRLKKADPARVTYVVDRNINYTNICVSGCRFCAFFKPPGHPEGYVMSHDRLAAKIAEAVDLGATQILLQGGMHPDLRLDFYTGMLRFIKETFPAIDVHGFSPPEIAHIAKLEGSGIDAVIASLKDAGLDSIPGGGAEILTDEARRRVSPGKCSAREWLDVMERAHNAGLRTSATMMFGHGESVEERADHLLALREVQDRTGGFVAFIPWSFQPANTDLAGRREPGGHEYLRTLAVSRLALDNFDNIQASWVTQGARVAQVALFFGANDFGSTMIEENVVAAAGVNYRISREEIENLIRSAGFRAARRNQGYRIIG
jgi:cyclic dehypoxanthinyl futalosine synthase